MSRISFISTIACLTVLNSCSKFPDLGNGYQLDYNGRHDISIGKCLREGDAWTVFIYGHILEYAFDEKFIVVAERPRDSIPECAGKIPGMTLDKCNDAFEKSTFRQYWILDKTKHPVFDESTKIYSNLYGPYNETEYLLKRKELSVPNTTTISYGSGGILKINTYNTTRKIIPSTFQTS